MSLDFCPGIFVLGFLVWEKCPRTANYYTTRDVADLRQKSFKNYVMRLLFSKLTLLGASKRLQSKG